MSKFCIDLIERTAATYLESFAGLLILSGVTDLGAVKTAAVSAVPAALAVVKGLLASRFGDSTSAALLPAPNDQGVSASVLPTEPGA